MKTTVRWDEFDQLTERLEHAVKRCEPLTDLDWALFCFSPKSPGPVISSGRASISRSSADSPTTRRSSCCAPFNARTAAGAAPIFSFPACPPAHSRGIATPKLEEWRRQSEEWKNNSAVTTARRPTDRPGLDS